MAKVLISGTDQRFGAALAVVLAQQGHLVAAGSPEGGLPEGATEDLAIEPVSLDLSASTASIERGVDSARRLLDGLDWVIVDGPTGPLVPLELISDEVLDGTVAFHLVGPIRLLRAAIPDLRGSSDPRILAISTLAATTGLPASGACSAARAGLEVALEALRYELLPDGIRVSVIQAVSPEPSLGHDHVDADDDPYYRPLLDAARELRIQASRSCDPLHVVARALEVLAADRPEFRYPLGRYAALASELRGSDRAFVEVVERLYRLDEWLIRAGG